MATTLAPTISDERLDAVITHLKSLNRHAFLQYAVTVAKYIVDQLHGGDFKAALAADKQGGIQALTSRRRLELAELDLTGRTLRKYVAAAAVWNGLPQDMRAKLGIDHLERLAAVSDDVERKKLASEAASMEWTRNQVATAVRQFQNEKRGGAKKRGRKPTPKPLKLAAAVARAAKGVAAHHGAAKSMSEAHRAEWNKTIEDAIAALKALVA